MPTANHASDARCISRRNMLACLAGAGSLSALVRGEALAADKPRPNIVLFLSDDMGWKEAGINGNTQVPTPAMNQIAREGVKLSQFYVQPVCSPTRGCLMTGRYAWKTGTELRPTGVAKQGMLLDERTIAQALRDAGYTTWMIGKWHLGEWQTAHLPRARGFDHHYGFYGALIDSFTHTRGGVLDWHRNGKPLIEEGYSSFLFADEACRLISQHDGKRPFFLYMPFNAVHGPVMAPPEYVKKYKQFGQRAQMQADLECLDLAMAQVMKSLRDKGIDGETLVIYLNDNGGPRGGSNAPYRGVKSHYHEGGMRVAAAMRWPGRIRAGITSDEMLHAVDIFPTLCGLAGADPNRGRPLDGKDAWATIASAARSPQTEIVHSLDVIRAGDWKFIKEGAHYYQWPKQPLQLYNIREDPYEEHNLAGRHPEIVSKLRERLAYHRRFARDGEPEQPIPNYPPVVYGEEEDRQYGESLREKVRDLKLKEQREGAS